jgi:MFS family permease
MDNGEKQLTGHESLQIIQQMIQSAKQEQRDDGKGWIIWGWMLFLSSVLTVANLHFNWASTFFFWNIFGLLSILLLLAGIVRRLQAKNKGGVKTYTREVFQKLNIGFTITLLLIIVAMNVGINPMMGFPLLTALYGFWVLIYGALLNFKPSIVAAYITWALALIAMFVPTFQWVMILHGAAVFAGYIVPGYIAKREFKKSGRQAIN